MYNLLVNKAVKYQIKILKGCGENSKKTLGATFCWTL